MFIKIVHLITGLNTGGAETMLDKLISGMDTRKFQNVVVSMGDAGPVGARMKKFNIPVLALNMRRGSPSLRGAWQLFQILRKEQPDILQTWLYHADLLGLIAGRLARVPLIVWNIRRVVTHEADTPSALKYLLTILTWLSALPDGILVNSEAGKRSHENIGYRPKFWRVIPNGFDLKQYSPDPGAGHKLKKELAIPTDVILIGLMARFHPLKDHKCFLEAAAHLLTKHYNLHFILAGTNIHHHNEELMSIISTLGLNKVVHLLGERSDMWQVLAGLDLVCSTSKAEGFSNVIGEAMACGVPCIVTDVGDSAKIVGTSGKVVLPQNPMALADACCEYIDLDKGERQRLGMMARQRIEENFNISSVVNEYETLYSELMKS